MMDKLTAENCVKDELLHAIGEIKRCNLVTLAMWEINPKKLVNSVKAVTDVKESLVKLLTFGDIELYKLYLKQLKTLVNKVISEYIETAIENMRYDMEIDMHIIPGA